MSTILASTQNVPIYCFEYKGLFWTSEIRDIEKGCDQVIGYRQKKKGMSWRETGSRGLGILKVAELNHQWERFWFPIQAANDSTNLQLASNS